jgi:2-dehydropantoate 2-reductase
MHLSSQAPVLLVGRRPLNGNHTLIEPDGSQHWQALRSCTASQLTERDTVNLETVHLTTKAYATEAALVSLACVLPSTTPLVLWQNGFTVQPAISARWPGPVLCASTTEGAYINDADRQQTVVHAGRGQTVIGDLASRHAELAATLAGRLAAAGLAAEAVPDIRLRLWHKLAVNAAINPLVARFGIRNGQLRDRPFRPMVTALIGEIQAILEAEDIAPPAAGWPELIWGVIASTAGNRASMFQDVLAGRPTEHEAILGPLCDAARHHGLKAQQLEEQLAWLVARQAQLSTAQPG